jgi:hypothetical protein
MSTIARPHPSEIKLRTQPPKRHGQAPAVKIWSRDQFQSLGDFGVFEGARACLIDGIIYEGGEMGPLHATGLARMQKCLLKLFPDDPFVRNQSPFNVGKSSDPMPDFAVVPGNLDTYTKAHPTKAVLIVEISDESLTFDLTEKAEKYAEAMVPEYWAVDLNGKRLHVLRNPGPLAPGGFAFAEQRVLAPGESVSPLAAPDATVQVADLF